MLIFLDLPNMYLTKKVLITVIVKSAVDKIKTIPLCYRSMTITKYPRLQKAGSCLREEIISKLLLDYHSLSSFILQPVKTPPNDV